ATGLDLPQMTSGDLSVSSSGNVRAPLHVGGSGATVDVTGADVDLRALAALRSLTVDATGDVDLRALATVNPGGGATVVHGRSANLASLTTVTGELTVHTTTDVLLPKLQSGAPLALALDLAGPGTISAPLVQDASIRLSGMSALDLSSF